MEIKLQLWLQLNEGGIKSKTGFCLTLMGIFSLAGPKRHNDPATCDIRLQFERIFRGGVMYQEKFQHSV
jgi:hypothetical protein